MAEYLSKEQLIKTLWDNYGATGYVDVDLDSVIEVINTISTIEITESND